MTGVVVSVNAKPASWHSVGDFGDDALHFVGQRAPIRVAEHDPARASVERSAGAGVCIVGIGLVAVEEVFAIDDHLSAGRHERTDARCGRRNGYKPRTLNTRVGRVALAVPQVRECDRGPYEPSLFHRFQRSERALLVACSEEG